MNIFSPSGYFWSKLIGITALGITAIILFRCKTSVRNDQAKQYNVLFIIADDLRPQLGCYGDKMVKSPNIDRLAEQGYIFTRAYCQQALCGPSRTSFLTGYRPEKTKVRDIVTHFRSTIPDAITLPQLFKNNGYESVGLFKVFHLVGFAPRGFGNLNDTVSWSIPLWLPTHTSYGTIGDSLFRLSYRAHLKKGPIGYNNLPRSLAFEATDVKDSMMNDGQTAQRAIRYISQLKDKPFFMAVGFYHPHLPFTAPAKYWGLYNEDSLTLPDNQYKPVGAPDYAVVDSKELRSYVNIPDTGTFSTKLKKQLLHGYLASISYVDAQIGLVLDELKRQDLDKNTIIVLMGDHGYQVGEHNMWGKKHTNFEISTHAPLIISVPDMRSGQRIDKLVEFIDIYPTLADLCHLNPPSDLDGRSLLPLLYNPDTSTWNYPAFSSYPRGSRMGTSIRTDDFRLTEWKLNQEEPVYELYDHRSDPEENKNVAGDAEYWKMKNSLGEEVTGFEKLFNNN